MKRPFSFERLKHGGRLWLMLTLVVLVLAGALAVGAWRLHAAKRTDAPHADQITKLVQSCVAQMISDTCRVKSGPTPPPTADRVFIAGIGEVDGNAYANFQRQGDAMCQSVGAECQADWNGAGCRIGKALYASPP